MMAIENEVERALESVLEENFEFFNGIQELLKSGAELRADSREHALLLAEKLNRAREDAERNHEQNTLHMEAMQHHLWMHLAHSLHSVLEAVISAIESQEKLKKLEEQAEQREEAKQHREEYLKQEAELLVLLAEVKAKHEIAETHLFHFHESPQAKAHEGFVSTIYPSPHPTPPSGHSNAGEPE